MEKATESLLKDTKAFNNSVNCTPIYHLRMPLQTDASCPKSPPASVIPRSALFTSGAGFATHFATLFRPIAGEYDLIGKNPDAAHTIKNVDKYEEAMEELRGSVGPELELIESRISGPLKDFQGVLKVIRKTITKREHKVCRFRLFLMSRDLTSYFIVNRLRSL